MHVSHDIHVFLRRKVESTKSNFKEDRQISKHEHHDNNGRRTEKSMTLTLWEWRYVWGSYHERREVWYPS